MSRILLATTPAQGHTAPMLTVAEHLVSSSHEVVFLTTAHFAEKVAATGARFVPLRPEADRYTLFVTNPEHKATARRGVRGVKDDLRTAFLEPAPFQYRDLLSILGGFPADVVLVDTTFVGIAPLGLGGAGAPARLPALAMLGVLPLTVSSRDTAPFGTAIPPSDDVAGRLRNRALNWLLPHVAMRDVQRYAQDLLAGEGCEPLDHFVMDAPAHLVGAYLQATVQGFEYPRHDLPPSVHFIGPILPPPATAFVPPAWWPELDGGRPVVHVTQGTIDNTELTRLVLPTMEALADDDLLVVATTGGPDPASVARPLPGNARLERFVPHSRLLDKVAVMVTNGGYGGVQQALARGVPLVVAGDSEDKPEVAARVAWSGTGINLRSGRPGPERIATAVRRVLAEPSFGVRARAVRDEMTAHDPLAELEAALTDLVGRVAA